MRAAVLLTSLLLFAGLAGCFGGGDDVDTEDEQSVEPVVSETTGAIQGTVLTADLDFIQGASVSLVSGNELIQEATTNGKGEYALNNIEPGTYRIQVNAICCEGNFRGVVVEANKVDTQDFMLNPLADFDFGKPYVHIDEFKGFVSCVLVVGSTTFPVCAPVDEQHGITALVPVDPGLETVTVAMVWDSTGVSTDGNEMMLEVRDETTNTDELKALAEETGSSPIQWQMHNSDFPTEESFQGRHEGSWHISFTGLVVEDPTFVYQRQFSIHYAFHYWEPAPDGYSALPDA